MMRTTHLPPPFPLLLTLKSQATISFHFKLSVPGSFFTSEQVSDTI
jgi:hypothetical protein